MSENNFSNSSSFNTESSIFMGAQRNPQNCKVGLFGVPYDSTTSFRPGARFGPSAIREVSNGLETYCPQIHLDLENINFADLGSIKISHGAPEPVIDLVSKVTAKIIKLDLKPLMLGGEHSITSGAISAITKVYKNLVLVQLDAHADLREEWLGSKHNHACAMRRCLEVLPSKQLLQIGIRSGTHQEFEELCEQKRLIKYTSGHPAIPLEEALRPHLGKPIYLTVDLDWFDPSVLPGTGTPEPGGFLWNDFAAIINILKSHQLVGADVVELAPQIDPTGISSILAAKVTRSLIMLLGR